MIIDSDMHFRFLWTIRSSEKFNFHYVFRNINGSLRSSTEFLHLKVSMVSSVSNN